MDSIPGQPIYFAILVLIAPLLFIWKKHYWAKPLPPGPRGLPFIGNIHQHSTQISPWELYSRWHDQYGPIIYFKLGQRTIISLGTREAARDLLERRARIYSSRPQLIVLGEWITNNMLPTLSQFNPRWEALHRVQASLLSPHAVKSSRPVFESCSKELLFSLLREPWTPRTFGGFVLKAMSILTYGQEIKLDQPDVFHDDFQEAFAAHTTQKDLLIELFPSLKSVLSMFGRFKRTKREGGEIHVKLLRTFKAKATIGRQARSWNYVKEIDRARPNILVDEDVLYSLVDLELASTVTTSAMLNNFINIWVAFPATIQKAQHELDTICPNRLPTFTDRENLPYLGAVISELFRFTTMLPLGFPRATVQDDFFMGYHIPNGAIIITNQWYMNRNDAVYEDAQEFRPERWLENEHLPQPSVFGNGKRQCPGQHLAQDTFFLVMSGMLWAYNIHRLATDGTSPTGGGSSWALDIGQVDDVALIVRSEMHESVLHQEWADAIKDSDVMLEYVKQERLSAR
ncbi:cytochrome P450 [Aspergillus californicus]